MTVRDRHTILIIDQAKQACETYRKSLLGDQDCAYTILEEQSAADALALCQSRLVDGILLNYRLPDGDGLQFLSMLKQQAGSTYPPIVIVAEQRDETIAIKAIKSGAEDYLVKQKLTPDALRFTMRTAIENARLRHQLQQSENRFHASVEAILDCYGIYSTIRDESGKIVDFRVEYVNAAACKNNQLTKEQQIGKRLCQILPGHRESGLFDDYCQLVETGIPLKKESLIYADQYGQHHLVKAFDIRATKLDDGFVATWRDVTEQVQVRLAQQQQLERERLVNQITQQIQQSLDLDMILQTTVNEVRQFLRSDRAFIYRFNPDFSGDIVVEAVGDGWNPILNQSVVDTYFVETKGEAYRQGRIQVVPNIYTAGLTDCHIKLLERFQIRANVVVPILQGEFLWGLMIVSQCTDSRSWASEDVELLQHLAAHVGIAIQQSELYEQLRQKLIAHEQAETALSQSEAQFSTLVANIPGVVYRSLPGSGCPMIYISDGIEAITGYPAQDFAVHGTRTFASIIAPEDRQQVELGVENAVQARVPYELEYRLLHADGSRRWVYEKGQGNFDDQGNLLYLNGVIFNITDRKRIEAVLQAKERQFETLSEASPAAIFRFDAANNCVYMNRRWSEMTGSAAEAGLGLGWVETLHPDDRDSAAKKWLQWCQATEPNVPFRNEARCLRPDGSIIWFFCQALPEIDEQGTLVGYVGALVDITDRKQAEDALRQSQETIQHQFMQIESIYQTAPIGLAILDPDLRFVRINQLLAENNGIAVEAHLGRTIYEVVPNLADKIAPLLHHLLETGEPILGMEISGETPAQPGVCRTWQESWFPLKQPDGTVVGINVVVQEITDRKQAQQHLENQIVERTATLQQVVRELQSALDDLETSEKTIRNNEAQYRRIVETATEGIWQVDATGNTTFVNQQMATMLGYELSEMIGKPLINFMDAEGRNIALHHWQQRQQGIHEHHDFKFRHHDGSDVWAIVSGSTIFDENGQMIGALGMLTNITERKQAEQKIREQAALLNITADAIIVRDLNNQILFWNAGAEHLFGWTAAEAIGQASTLLWRDVSSYYVDVLQTVIEQGYWQGELQKITKENQEITVQSRWTLMTNDAGEPTSILTVDTDITEQKRLEAQFLRTQRLESIGTLASGIAHDLNNILTPILAASQFLLHKLPNLSERDKNLLKIIADNSKRGADLVKQILLFARGAEGQRVVVQVEHLLQEVSKIIQRTFPKSIELQNDIVTTPLWLVSADATQLHQVLMNLCVNARDAMPTGGILTLSAQNIQIDETYANLHPDAHPGTYLKITVADTGCGIPAEQLDRIFDPFFTTKETGEGTGLGLSTVLGIIKNHDGFVRISSAVGEGTQFQVYLPTVSGMAVVQTEDEALPAGNQEVILIVDDEQPICDTIQTLLEQHNYKTLIAHDGIEAIATYAQHRDSIDVVLMDTRMPLLDGLTAIRALQRMNPHLKIIAASGLDLNKQLNANDGNGSIAFLQKPYSMKELLNMISAILHSS